MMPLQSIEAQPPHLGPGLASLGPAASAVDNGERQQKPKTLPCKYCSKRFRRVEHVQRHERTHTKEKPFACGWARCGKTFGRRDLLVRHEKLVHLNEGSGNKDANRQRRLSGATGPQGSSPENHHEVLNIQRTPVQQHQQPQLAQQQQHHPAPPPPPHQVHTSHQYSQSSISASGPSPIQQDPRARAAACNLDLLSDAALATEVNQGQSMMVDMNQQQQQQQQSQHQQHQQQPHQPQQHQPQQHQQQQPQPVSHSRIKSYDDSMGYPERPREDPGVLSQSYPPQTNAATPYYDYNLFLDDYGGPSHFLPPPFEPDQQFGGLWNRPSGEGHQRGLSKPVSQFPSRFPSVQPDGREGMDIPPRSSDDTHRAPPLRISAVDHSVIKNRLEEFSSVLPSDFVFPSRHTLTRFLEGYISGFHEYLPFLHLPTLAPQEMAPELLLAVLAVGAQYRFESGRSHALWYAAKSVALEQIRRRHSHEVHALLPTPAAYSPHSTRPSPSAGFRHSFPAAQQERPVTQDTHREPFSPNTPQARLETIQAVLLLFAVGLWGASAILHEALSLQSHLAILVRAEGLTAESSPGAAPDWESWVRLEGASRTKLIAYCFFNLCSIAYNMPPLLLTSDLNLFLPSPSRLWRAESAWQWQDARQAYPLSDITVRDAFARLFGRSAQGLPPNVSSLGHYVLIHALTQHIYLLKQTSMTPASPYEPQRGLRPEDVEEVTQALRIWQNSFEHRHQLRAQESVQIGFGDSFPGGPVAFNATALLRLAYIRLYTDMSPSRSLETRDHMLVASSLSNMPPLIRSLRLHRAVFQAIHALSMLVKAGVNYVARAKSLEWSIQHSLCNFECAALLSKWLLTLSLIGPNDAPVSAEEKNLLDMVRRMLDETEFAVPIDPSLGGPSAGQPASMEAIAGDSTRLRQLAAAVIRLWAETFKGSHVFDLVRVMGSSLDGYANLVEKPRDRTPLGARMVPE